jgi:dihydrofolate reductase
MQISLIAAMSLNRVIGHGAIIPWHVPGEQRLFRKITLGNSIIMGRVTHEAMGKVLDGRPNIILTHQKDYRSEGCQVVHSMGQAIKEGARFSEEVFIIGGETLFREALSHADRIYLSTIQVHAKGDVFFPEFDTSGFNVIEHLDVPGDIPYTFTIYERIRT